MNTENTVSETNTTEATETSNTTEAATTESNTTATVQAVPSSTNTVSPASTTAPTSPKGVINAEQAERIQTALRALYSVAGGGDSGLPDSFDKCSPDDREKICTRAVRALARREKAIQEAYLSGIKSKIVAVVSPRMAAAVSARSAFNSLPAAARSFMQPFPEDIAVNISEFTSCFPVGCPLPKVTKALQHMGYKIGKNAKAEHTVVFFALPPVSTPAMDQAAE